MTLLLTFFLIDLLSLQYFSYPITHAVLCYSISAFLCSSFSLSLCISFFLLGLESFFVIDLFGFKYLYIVPLFLLIHSTKHYFVCTNTVALFTLLTGIVSNRFLLSSFGLNTPFWGLCTLYEFGANLLLLLISLKWFSTVERGNRF